MDAVTGLFPVSRFGSAIVGGHTMRMGFEGLGRLQNRERPRSKTVASLAVTGETSEPVLRLLSHLPSLKLGVIESLSWHLECLLRIWKGYWCKP